MNSFFAALNLLFSLDPETWGIIGVSLHISLFSVGISVILGIPLGLLLSYHKFKGKELVVTILNSLQALPTVLVGLVVYSFFSRKALFGDLGWMYSTKAIILGQSILIIPLMVILSLSAVQRLDRRYRQTALTLGANAYLIAWVLLKEARFAMGAAVITAFGRVIAEVGISMMLGGNIKGYTRTMTTAMALEYDKGAFDLALALGLALLLLSLVINVGLRLLQGHSDV